MFDTFRKKSIAGLMGCIVFWTIWTIDQWLPFWLAETYPEIQEYGLIVATILGYVGPVLVFLSLYICIKPQVSCGKHYWIAIVAAVPTALWNSVVIWYAWKCSFGGTLCY